MDTALVVLIVVVVLALLWFCFCDNKKKKHSRRRKGRKSKKSKKRYCRKCDCSPCCCKKKKSCSKCGCNPCKCVKVCKKNRCEADAATLKSTGLASDAVVPGTTFTLPEVAATFNPCTTLITTTTPAIFQYAAEVNSGCGCIKPRCVTGGSYFNGLYLCDCDCGDTVPVVVSASIHVNGLPDGTTSGIVGQLVYVPPCETGCTVTPVVVAGLTTSDAAVNDPQLYVTPVVFKACDGGAFEIRLAATTVDSSTASLLCSSTFTVARLCCEEKKKKRSKCKKCKKYSCKCGDSSDSCSSSGSSSSSCSDSD